MHVEKGIIMENTLDSYGEYMSSEIVVMTYMFKYYEIQIINKVLYLRRINKPYKNLTFSLHQTQ